jgi:diguanylate cyclase (GGDEF)-like protein
MRQPQPIPLGERVGAATRCVVLLAVFLMTRWQEESRGVAFSSLDWVLIGGGVYVLATTFATTTIITRASRFAGGQRAMVLTVLDILLVTWLVWADRGVRSELYILYYLPVLQAGLRLNLRDAVGASVLAAIAYVFIAFARGVNVQIESTGILRVATFAVSAIVLALLLGLLAHQARLERSERERAEEFLKRTCAIYEIARTVNATLDLDPLLEQLAATAARECGADAARVVLTTAEEPMAPATAGREALFGEGDDRLDAAKWILHHEEPLAIKHGRTVTKGAEGVRAPGGARHYLGVPMIGKGHLVGAIELASRGGDGFRAVDGDLLLVIAAQAAVAIENARQYSRAQLLAITDRLTGLWNHAEFHQRLREEVARAQRHGRPVSLLFADIDRFKSFNDTYGHRLGDDLLRQVAARLQAAVRHTDFAARYGGDEFAVILPETTIHGAAVACDNLRRAIEQEPFRVGGQRLGITISGGVGAYPEGGASAEELIDACDRALREAKKAGGNYIMLTGNVR